MSVKHWLFKADPKDYSIQDLANEPNQTTSWDGIRNYMARNLIRDEIKKGDNILIYHSNADPKGIVGIGQVVRSAYPDHTALDQSSDYYDPKSSKDNPIWYMVDVKLIKTFPEVIELRVLKDTKGLEKMMLTQRGSRLSIQPVRKSEWNIIMQLASKVKWTTFPE